MIIIFRLADCIFTETGLNVPIAGVLYKSNICEVDITSTTGGGTSTCASVINQPIPTMLELSVEVTT